jgi:hypothetical protein
MFCGGTSNGAAPSPELAVVLVELRALVELIITPAVQQNV